VASDAAAYLREESAHTEAYSLEIARLEDAMSSLETEFSPSVTNQKLLDEAAAKSPVRLSRRNEGYTAMVKYIIMCSVQAS
jgi:proteasome activator subunit 4